MPWYTFRMGNGQSRNQPPRHDFNGPLFGGHYPGDFSIRNREPDLNKPLPALPKVKTVGFATDPAPWVFYKHRPSDENTVNTRYCHPGYLDAESDGSQKATPPPAYGAWGDDKGFFVRNH